MRGLMIKDLKLMWAQKMFYAFVLLAAAGVFVTTGNAGFIVGYLTFMCGISVISTISYDEYDNGSVFLFALPITRKTYVREKYLFGLLSGTAAWIVSVCFYIINELQTTSQLHIKESLLVVGADMAAVIFMLAIMLPVQFKFGAEKGRMVMIGIIGCAVAVGMLGMKLLEQSGIVVSELLHGLESLPMGVLTGIVLLIAVAVLGISYLCSIKIMEKREL